MDQCLDDGCESTQDSSDMVWESIKVDFKQNRDNQTEQLQSLKGKVVRPPAGKQKVRKRSEGNKHKVKNYSKTKSFRKALDFIRVVARSLKGTRRAAPLKDDRTRLKFEVFDNAVALKTVAGNDIIPYSSTACNTERTPEGSHPRGPQMTNESVQTEEKKLNDKFAQTNVQENLCSHVCDQMNSHLFMRQQALSCGMFMPGFSTCCPSPFTTPSMNVCPCSLSGKTDTHKHQLSDAEKEAQSSSKKSSISQYSLKEICEELLVQLSARERNGSPANSLSEKNCVRDNIKTIAYHADPTLSDVDRLWGTLKKSILKDLKNQASGDKTASTFTTSKPCESAQTEVVSSRDDQQNKTSLLDVTPPSPGTTDVASSGVTPDLLQLAAKVEENVRRSNTSTISKEDHQQVMQMKAPPPAGDFKQGAVDQTRNFAPSKNLHKPTSSMQMSSVGQACNNLPKIQEATQHGSLCNVAKDSIQGQNISINTVQVLDKVDRSSNVADVKANNFGGSLLSNASSKILKHSKMILNDKPGAWVSEAKSILAHSSQNSISEADRKKCESEELLLRSGNNCQTTVKAGIQPLLNKTEKSEHTVTVDGKETTEKSAESSEADVNSGAVVNDQKCIGNNKVKRSINFSAIEALTTGEAVDSVQQTSQQLLSCESTNPCTKPPMEVDDHAQKQGSKCLARMSRTCDTNIADEKIPNTPAFEEMDPKEMETVLLIWRQQEQLHQGHAEPKKSAASSPGFLFKKLKGPRELPPELRNVKILQPPPLRKRDDSSALQILDEEVKKPEVEDDSDDIPETSPVAIPPPKKRKLRLKKNPTSPLPVVFQKSKQSPEDKKPDPIEGLTQNGADLTSSADPKYISRSVKAETVKPSEDVGKKTTKEGARLSLRLKAAEAAATSKENFILEERRSNPYQDIKVKGIKETDMITSERKQSKSGRLKEVETLENLSTVDVKEVEMNNNSFKDQIKERVHSLTKQWLKEKSHCGSNINLDRMSRSTSPAPSLISECFQGLLFQDSMAKLKDVSVSEIGKAHDLVVNIILNPWRGINAKCATRDFVCPNYDSKSVMRFLWDLRSGANSDDIVKRIISLGWKEVHHIAFKALVTLFVLSLDRSVPFVIEAAVNGDEDDTSSVMSDVDHCSKKKATAVRLIATKQIFKGECIEGLNGIVLKLSKKDKTKDKLKSWIFPKLGKNRDCVVFGPLAYLKRKEGGFNTEAIFLKNDVVVVRALRQILSGERLLVSFAPLEITLSN